MPHGIVCTLSWALQNCKVCGGAGGLLSAKRPRASSGPTRQIGSLQISWRRLSRGSIQFAVSRVALTLLALLITTCPGFSAPAENIPLRHEMLGVANGCFVETVVFLDRWAEVNGPDAWARLLQWGAREDEEVVMGHAVAICEVRGALWCWDGNFGWMKLAIDAAQRDAAEVVAVPVWKKYPKVSARFPLYRADFPQVPASVMPVAQLTNSSAAIRDASIVAAHLAKRRPVNAVRFYYRAGEEKRESAAAVFVFHGRYCVYVPEIGTVPFRVRGDVANLRLIQDLLRRGFPGVTGLEKL